MGFETIEINLVWVLIYDLIFWFNIGFNIGVEYLVESDVEIMVYLGILDTSKYLGSQKILTGITAILS